MQPNAGSPPGSDSGQVSPGQIPLTGTPCVIDWLTCSSRVKPCWLVPSGGGLQFVQELILVQTRTSQKLWIKRLSRILVCWNIFLKIQSSLHDFKNSVLKWHASIIIKKKKQLWFCNGDLNIRCCWLKKNGLFGFFLLNQYFECFGNKP